MNRCNTCQGKGYIVSFDLITLIEEAFFRAIGMRPRRRPCRRCQACRGSGMNSFNLGAEWQRWKNQRRR